MIAMVIKDTGASWHFDCPPQNSPHIHHDAGFGSEQSDKATGLDKEPPEEVRHQFLASSFLWLHSPH